MINSAHYFLLDVFTGSKFGGNQLAIFPEGQFIDESLMKKIARELQLSETVFILPPENKENHFSMRIFTPEMELPTAGHPTIGASFFMVRHIDFHEEESQLDLTIEQPVGLIKSSVKLDRGVPLFSSMIQPLPEFIKILDDRKSFIDMLTLKEDSLSETPIEMISCGVPFTFIQLRSLACIQKIKFNVTQWEALKEKYGTSFIYVFTTETFHQESHVHGRMFAPEAGIMEDAATGSANGPLGCYLLKNKVLDAPAGQLSIISEQGFEMGRPSIIHIDIKGQPDKITEVKISGESVLVGKGQIFLDR